MTKDNYGTEKQRWSVRARRKATEPALWGGIELLGERPVKLRPEGVFL